MVNWRTTLLGALAAILPFVKSIIPAELGTLVDAAQAFALALLGYFAKDKNVTGIHS